MHSETAEAAASLIASNAASPVLPVGITTRGDSIYFGDVYTRDGAGAQPVYVYERRVGEREQLVASTHMTREPSGAIVLAETALHTHDYALREYTLHANQLGQSGTIHVADGKVRFDRQTAKGQRRREESASDPVVVGPTLVGYIVRNLKRLRAGQSLRVRMALLDRLRSIGFDLRVVHGQADAGQTCVQMKPANFVIGLLVSPVEFYFDNATDTLLRLQGPVPPKLRSSHGWKDFEARVEYRYVAATYR